MKFISQRNTVLLCYSLNMAAANTLYSVGLNSLMRIFFVIMFPEQEKNLFDKSLSS